MMRRGVRGLCPNQRMGDTKRAEEEEEGRKIKKPGEWFILKPSPHAARIVYPWPVRGLGNTCCHGETNFRPAAPTGVTRTIARP